MIAYTDGSAKPYNPGLTGGFGVVFLTNDMQYIGSYSKQYRGPPYTTNNREEMKAIIFAIIYAALRNEDITIYSDSSYAINAFSLWRHKWKLNKWLKSDNTTPENLDLLLEYDKLIEKYSPRLEKVKGHSMNKWNEMADKLARGDQKGDINE